MERRQHHKRAAILIKLPDGKAEAAFGAINPEHLPALPDEDREGPGPDGKSSFASLIDGRSAVSHRDGGPSRQSF
jgi:hypothetical protein